VVGGLGVAGWGIKNLILSTNWCKGNGFNKNKSNFKQL
jgi:hypothetical protein